MQVKLRLNAAGRHHWPPPDDTIALVRQLARLMPDRQIARLLNRSGKLTGYGNGWTEQRVRGFRNHHDIAVYRDGEWADHGEITHDAAAQIVSGAPMPKTGSYVQRAPWPREIHACDAHRARFWSVFGAEPVRRAV